MKRKEKKTGDTRDVEMLRPGPKGFDVDFYEFNSIDVNPYKLYYILAFCCFIYSKPAAVH